MSHPTPLQAAPPVALPIVFVNLDEDEQRRDAMQHQFAAFGIRAERLRAVRWTRLDAGEQARLYSDELNRRSFFKPLLAGEKGCYASHLQAWRQLLDSKAPALVVLEDDVELEPGFCEVVNAIARLPTDWDMIKLIGREREKAAADEPLAAGHRRVHYRRVPSLTAGYVVSRAGAAKLLAKRVPFGRPIDVDLRFWWECALVIQGVVPPVIRLAALEAQSSIGARPRGGMGERWRKFLFKLHYAWANARARGRL